MVRQLLFVSLVFALSSCATVPDDLRTVRHNTTVTDAYKSILAFAQDNDHTIVSATDTLIILEMRTPQLQTLNILGGTNKRFRCQITIDNVNLTLSIRRDTGTGSSYAEGQGLYVRFWEELQPYL